MVDERDDDTRPDDEGARMNDIGSDAPTDAESETDALLSALVDGELDPVVEAKLRERISREPALAERYAAFENLNASLQALPAPPLRADFAARMRARIAQQEEASGLKASGLKASDLAPPTLRPATRDRARTAPRRPAPLLAAAGLAAAAAAGVVFYLADPAVAPDLPIAQPVPRLEARETPSEAETSLLASAGEEELGIALYYDELAALEILDQLEMLEILAAIEEAERS